MLWTALAIVYALVGLISLALITRGDTQRHLAVDILLALAWPVAAYAALATMHDDSRS